MQRIKYEGTDFLKRQLYSRQLQTPVTFPIVVSKHYNNEAETMHHRDLLWSRIAIDGRDKLTRCGNGLVKLKVRISHKEWGALDGFTEYGANFCLLSLWSSAEITVNHP